MRRTERVAVELSVRWVRSGVATECIGLDINAHGMFLSTHHVVEHGALMQLEVQLPDRVLSMFVTARYVGRTMRGQGIGAEIFLIDDVSRSHWMSYYEAEAARQHGRADVALAG
ncbi:MAG: hypothetical protein JWM53_2772 [bacterium]|nr:hypothetical protein [bacterium]